MSSVLQWSPTEGYPTATVTSLKSIATTHMPALTSSLAKIVSKIEHADNKGDIYSLSQVARGVQASMLIISAEMVLATATDSEVEASATEVILEAMYNLEVLADDLNHYHYYLNRFGNIFFLAIFFGIFAFNALMLIRSRYHWYNVTFIAGYLLQFVGYIFRIMSFRDNTVMMYFAIQSFALTISPAFIMGGIYFLFAQCVIVHGPQYSILKPMWYSYFFIGCDIISLLIQGAGGAMASDADKNKSDPTAALWVMFVGILFQVIAMTIFMVFWFEYIHRLYFRDRDAVPEYSEYKKATPLSYLKALFAAKTARVHKRETLEQFYTPKYANIRTNDLINHFNWAISIAVILIYIRCLYRTVELKQGFDGYLATHEVYLFVLDSTMVAAAGLILAPFHPVFVFGRENVLKLATIKGKDVPEAVESSSASEDKVESESKESTDRGIERV